MLRVLRGFCSADHQGPSEGRRPARVHDAALGIVYHPASITTPAEQPQQHQQPPNSSTENCQPRAKMAPRSALANISFTVDSASEDEMTYDELNALPTPDSNTENKAPTRKARGSAAQAIKTSSMTKPVAKGKTATRRVSGGSVGGVKKGSAAAAKKAPVKGNRKALAERNVANGSDTEEVDEFDEEEQPVQAKPAKRGRPAKKTQEDATADAPAPAKRGRKPAVKEPAAAKEAKTSTTAKSKTTKRAPKAETEPEKTIPETQPAVEEDPMDIEMSIEIDEIPETMPPPPRPSARRAQAQPSRARNTSTGVRRTGSVSDSERDPVLRRKVGDLTRKLEAMTVKYDSLKEAASSGKESNFEQLKKRTEQTAKGMSL